MRTWVGSFAPAFSAAAWIGGETHRLQLSDFIGKWVVLYFYPKDDTSVCASENDAFRSSWAEFERLGVQLLAASTDSIDDHRKWCDAGLGALPFPMIADSSKVMARDFGVLHEDTGLALPATFIIDPDGVTRYACVHDLPVGRSTDEILRTLQALQSGRPTQCNWHPGEPTL
jgi:peroxiredoxin (alkyl hydroperoxide reductase subunit C)